MSERDRTEGTTRRQLLVLSGAAAGAAVLPGCGMKPQNLCQVANCYDPNSDMSQAPADLTPLQACQVYSFTVPDADQMAVGQVRVVDNGQTLLRRDDSGYVAFLLICTHAGCKIALNAGAQSLDCPCHGSRFNLDGTVLHGPAARPLQTQDMCRVDGVLTISRSNFSDDITTRTP